MTSTALKALTRSAGVLAIALLIGGWGLAAHADTCTNANCTMQEQEAHDPAYQAAIHSAYQQHSNYGYQYGYYPYSYSNYLTSYTSSYSYNQPYNSYQPYNPYTNYSYYSDTSNYHYSYQYWD